MSQLGKPSAREEQGQRLAESLRRQLGPTGCDALRAAGVFELMLNPDGQLWQDRHGTGMSSIGTMQAPAAETFIGTVASMLRSTVTRESPILECELPNDPPFYGARFEAMLPPVVEAPTFTIRLPASRLFTLQDYVEHGIMTPRQRFVIQEAVEARQNILVVGGTTTGKTTLTNAILNYMSTVAVDHRLVLLEDTRELRCTSPNVVALRTSSTITMQRLLMATMRLRPDRIVVGEVRDGAALSLLKAWNTGHPGGASTIHANDARAGLVRLEQLIAEVSPTPMPALIAEAIDLIVSIAHTSEGRRIREVVAVTGYVDGAYQTNNLE